VRNPFKLLRRSSAPLVQVEPALPVVVAPASNVRRHRGLHGGYGVANGIFKAAETDRLNSTWGTVPLTADDIIRRNQMALVARSREQSKNNDYGRAYVRLCRQNIVGPKGITLQAKSKGRKGTLDTPANQAQERSFTEWGKKENCDVAGKKSWRAIQAICINSAATDGEFFVRKIYGKDAGPWGFALQVIDAQRCPVEYDEYNLPDGQFVRHGIKFNRFGRPISYFFTVADESAPYYGYLFYGTNSKFIEVPADEIIHGYIEEIAGQKRGLPWMATGLFRMRQLAGFEDAALVNARISASKMGFFTRDENAQPTDDDEEGPIEIDAEPGTFHELPTGIGFEKFDPQFPNGETAVFTKGQLRGLAAGYGVLYNNLASDLEGVNFSSIRQGTLDERENWKELQEWLIETLIAPVHSAWLPYSLLAGRITLDDGRPLKPERIAAYSVVAWQPRRWAWIDPRADVAAAVEAKNNLLTSPGAIIREAGKDPSLVWQEWAEDIREMQAAGIPDEYIKSAVLPEQWRITVDEPADAADAAEAGKTAADGAGKSGAAAKN
jgi:lambda family phage portal protein